MVEELKKIVAEEKEEIRRQYKTQIVAVFGSYARGDFHANSDLDLLVDVDPGASLFDLVDLQHFLEDRLGCKWMWGRETHSERRFESLYSVRRSIREKPHYICRLTGKG